MSRYMVGVKGSGSERVLQSRVADALFAGMNGEEADGTGISAYHIMFRGRTCWYVVTLAELRSGFAELVAETKNIEGLDATKDEMKELGEFIEFYEKAVAQGVEPQILRQPIEPIFVPRPKGLSESERRF